VRLVPVLVAVRLLQVDPERMPSRAGQRRGLLQPARVGIGQMTLPGAHPQVLQLVEAKQAEPLDWTVPSVWAESTPTVLLLHQVTRAQMRQVRRLVVRAQLRVVDGLVLGETELRLRPVPLLPGWEGLAPVVREWLRLLVPRLLPVRGPVGVLGWRIFGGCGLRFWRR
jgi:hypothetical protein